MGVGEKEKESQRGEAGDKRNSNSKSAEEPSQSLQLISQFNDNFYNDKQQTLKAVTICRLFFLWNNKHSQICPTESAEFTSTKDTVAMAFAV